MMPAAGYRPIGPGSGSIGTAGRTILAANTNYYISTLGSDSNPGTLAQPWATLQHAMDFTASKLDIGGFLITWNVANGSYVGFGVKTTVGGGAIQIFGNGSANTSIGAGPNDGTYNFGECIGGHVFCETTFAIDKITLAPNITGGGDGDCIAFSAGGNVQLATFNASATDLVIKPDAVNGAGAIFSLSGTANSVINSFGNATFNGNGASCVAFYGITAGRVDDGLNWTITGTASFSLAFAFAALGGFIHASTTYTGGTITGQRFISELGADIVGNSTGGMGPNFFPGNSAGTCDGSSSYDGFVGAISGAGLPTTTNFPDPGTGGLYKDTSGGGVYDVYNDAGTIKKVALT